MVLESCGHFHQAIQALLHERMLILTVPSAVVSAASHRYANRELSKSGTIKIMGIYLRHSTNLKLGKLEICSSLVKAECKDIIPFRQNQDTTVVNLDSLLHVSSILAQLLQFVTLASSISLLLMA